MRLAVALLCLPLVAACARSAGGAAPATTAAPRGADTTVGRVDGHVDIRSRGAHMRVAEQGRTLQLPAGFPGDVHRPDGFRVLSVMDVPQVLMVNGEAPGRRAQLFESARTAMRAQGWSEIHAGRLGQADSAAFRKDGRETVMTWMDSDGGVRIGMQLRTRQR